MNMEGNVVMRIRTLAVTLATAVMSIGMVANSHADNWLEDPTTGCAVWSDSDAVSKEVPTWSESCIDDKASGAGVLVVHDKEGLLLALQGRSVKRQGQRGRR